MSNITKNLKTFEVGIWWHELHGGCVTVEAETKEEAERLIKEDFEKFKNLLKQKQDTYSDLADNGVDEAVEIVTEESSSNDNVYSEKFNTDVYIEGTTGSYKEGNILELGRVIYQDYKGGEQPYEFGRPREYGAEFSYYTVGACPSRERSKVLFNKGDFRTLFFNRARQKAANNKYDFAKSIDDALSGNKHIIMLQMHIAEGEYKPRTMHIRAIKPQKYSYKIPYRLHLMHYDYIEFSSAENFTDTIVMNKAIKRRNGEMYYIFLNTPGHLNLLERIVEEFAIDTLA